MHNTQCAQKYSRRDDLEMACQPKTGRVETIVIEITTGCDKWVIHCSMYKQPAVTESEFVCLVDTVVDKRVRELYAVQILYFSET